MMRIPIDKSSDIPLYAQITTFLREQIENGILIEGTRLPPSRELANSLGVSRMTIVNAYAELEAEGLVLSVHGSGTFVAAPIQLKKAGDSAVSEWPLWQKQIVETAVVPLNEQYEQITTKLAPSNLISFASGMGTTEIFDADGFRKNLQAILRRDGAHALGYGDSKHGGYKPLRQTIAAILSSQGIPTHARDVLITSGSQQAIQVVATLLLRPGDVVLVEASTYEGAMDQFALLDARIVGVPMDEAGMRMDKLEEALRITHPKLIYSIPTFHNPTSISMSTQRRRQFVELAQHYNVPILEDDFAGDLRYEGHAQPALKALDNNGTVIYVNTFSKALIPGLRIGYLVANGPVYEQLLIHKRTGDRASSDMMQRALEAYISVGRYQSHLRKVARIYRTRRDAMLTALQEFMPSGVSWIRPYGGLFLWLNLPEGINGDTLLPAALKEGVAYVPASSFFPEHQQCNALRLNFTIHPPHRIHEGIKRLAQAIKKEIGD